MDPAIGQVRSFNRIVTRRIGVLEDEYLASGRPLGASRTLWEIGAAETDLRTLRARLDLDSGYLSRLVAGLERDGLVERRARPAPIAASAPSGSPRRAVPSEPGSTPPATASPRPPRAPERKPARAARGGDGDRGAPAHGRSGRRRAGGPAQRRRAALPRGLLRGDRRALRARLGPGRRAIRLEPADMARRAGCCCSPGSTARRSAAACCGTTAAASRTPSACGWRPRRAGSDWAGGCCPSWSAMRARRVCERCGWTPTAR